MSRTRPSRVNVLLDQKSSGRAVQHTLEILIGYYWLSDPRKMPPFKCMMEVEAVGKTLVHLVRWTVGPDAANNFLAFRGADVAH